MSKNLRRSVWAVLLLTLAMIAAATARSASACPAGWEGTWRSDDMSCRGAARDCSVIFVCGPMPV